MPFAVHNLQPHSIWYGAQGNIAERHPRVRLLRPIASEEATFQALGAFCPTVTEYPSGFCVFELVPPIAWSLFEES